MCGMALEDMTVQVQHRFSAAVPLVWSLLSDVERMAGLGPEHTSAKWADKGPALGARFTGINIRDGREWTVGCRITVYDEPHEIAWQTGAPESPTATWSYRLEPAGDGTLVTQDFRHGPGVTYLRSAIDKHPERAQEFIDGRAAELATNMTVVLSAADALLAAEH